MAEDEKKEEVNSEAAKESVKKTGAGGGEEKKKEQTPLQKFLQKNDVLLMLYPKDENGYYSDSIKERDEITVYKLLRERKNQKENLLIFLDTSGGNGLFGRKNYGYSPYEIQGNFYCYTTGSKKLWDDDVLRR